MHDAIVIGSGPNGLAAAAHLARAGMSVLVLEAKATLGGAVQTRELTLPGFHHDIGAGFFPFVDASSALTDLDLPGAGVVLDHAPIDTCHLATDGSAGCLARDLEQARRSLGPDFEPWNAIAKWHRATKAEVVEALLAPLPAIGPAWNMGFDSASRLAQVALHSGRSFGESSFATDAARRIAPGLALHTDVGPDDALGAVVGFMLAIMATSSGFPVIRGGAGRLTDALVTRVAEKGGEFKTNAHVGEIIVRDGRAVAVRLDDGTEIEAKKAIIADVGAPALYLSMLPASVVPARVRRAMTRYPYGFGTFKVDWALGQQVPFSNDDARRSSVVHIGDSVDDLARFTREVRAGKLAENPYLLLGQSSLADATRAPAGKHTLYGYSRVPSHVAGGWSEHRERFADALEARIEGVAPGFRQTILARRISAPDDLEAMNENLVGGDLGGGTAAITHQLFMRPVFPWFGAKTPVRGLFLGSSYTHPGPGVHGAAGRNAARAALG